MCRKIRCDEESVKFWIFVLKRPESFRQFRCDRQARQLWPDFVQVWPGFGWGRACGHFRLFVVIISQNYSIFIYLW